MASATSIMVVDDDQGLLRLLRLIFQVSGYEVQAFQDSRAALQALVNGPLPEVLVLDLRMAGLDGRDLFRMLLERNIHVPTVIASAFGARAAKEELGAEAYIEKPFRPEDLLAVVQQVRGKP